MKSALNVVLFVLVAAVAIAWIVYDTIKSQNRIARMERQIDQLTTAMPYALTWDKIDDVEVARYEELKSGNYILCFIDYRRNNVVAEYTKPYKPDKDAPTVEVETRTKYQPRYVRIFNVPEEVLDDWQWREIRSSPDLKRGTLCRAFQQQ